MQHQEYTMWLIQLTAFVWILKTTESIHLCAVLNDFQLHQVYRCEKTEYVLDIKEQILEIG